MRIRMQLELIHFGVALFGVFTHSMLGSARLGSEAGPKSEPKPEPEFEFEPKHTVNPKVNPNPNSRLRTPRATATGGEQINYNVGSRDSRSVVESRRRII